MRDVDPARRRTVTATRVAPGAARDGGDPDGFTYHVVTTVVPSSRRNGGLTDGGQTGDERRAGGRIRTRLRDASLSETRGRVLVDCRIHDRSRHGARLHLDKACALPKSFVVRDPSAGVDYRVTLVWQKGLEAGVRLAGG